MKKVSKFSEDYDPTPEEMGFNYDDFFSESVTEAQRKKFYASFRLAQREKFMHDKKVKAERLTVESLTHWYNCISESMLLDIVKNTMHNVDNLFQKVVDKETIESKRIYYLTLKERVKVCAPRKRYAEAKKLARFPKLDEHNKVLIGGAHSIVTFLCHVYSHKD